MPKYLLLLRDDRSHLSNLSPEEMQAMFQRYASWRDGLKTRAGNPSGQKLRDDIGRVMKQPNGKLIVTDGPYAEVREILGGFFAFEAESLDQAVEIAKDCPHLAAMDISLPRSRCGLRAADS